ncbi:hypothetical protein [Massilia glaciei]|uniref:Uncharacterized protein n=1 Tax=Massilia glaciei TaxID=1524097 RepID=A0A2U2HGG6_9BURK|nr:hypothetical protein [Massilia glaciei]PWF44006.1 hypothetical protein C7C56_019915 [Massilia glaciei]
MSLKKLLDAGQWVPGTKFDAKIKPLGEMSEAAQRRLGYTDADGYWTERGVNRATTRDNDLMRKSTIARAKSGK